MKPVYRFTHYHSLASICGLTFFLGCGDDAVRMQKNLLYPNEIRGEVVSVELNASTVSVKALALGRELDEKLDLQPNARLNLVVQPGDLSLLKNKSHFKGKLHETFTSSKGSGFLLHEVWPANRSDLIRVNNVNRLLRRDTLSMGDDMIRTVGDQVPPFALFDQDGEIITTDYFDGSVTVLNFIFTRCSVPDMCPASTIKMKELQKLVSLTGISNVKFLSITLDPAFDSPGILKSYAMGYSLNEENFRIGTAEKSVIDDLTRQFGILRKSKTKQPLDHTMRTIIVNSKRQIVYQVPGKGWEVKDFLSRLQNGEG